MTANTAWNSGSIAIATLDMREIIIGGLSDMGNADRGTFSQVPIEHGDRTTPAGVLGEITHSLIASEMPTHTHDGGTSPESVHHNHGGGDLYDAQSTGFAASGVVTVVGAVNNTGSGVTDNNTIDHTHTFTTNPSGGGISPAHNNTPRIMLGTFYMRL
jgi:hypothetical protein